MPFPDFRALRNIPVSKEDIVEAFNRETHPLLRQIREWLLGLRSGAQYGYRWTVVEDEDGELTPEWRPGGRVSFSAGELEPVSSHETNWAANSLAPLARSTDDSAVAVRVFGDGETDGGGFRLVTGNGTMVAKAYTRPRAFVSSDTTSLLVYAREMGGAWSQVGTSSLLYEGASWVTHEVEIDLSSFGAGMKQFELVRSSAGTLGGLELALLEVQ